MPANRDAFGEHAVQLGTQFAGPAAVSVYNAQLLARAQERTKQLQRALDSRAVIDQAIGIIRSRSGVSAEVAFDRLTRMSQTENIKLHVVAERLVDEAVRRARARRRQALAPKTVAAEANSEIAASSAGRAVPIGHQPPGHVGQVLAVGARVAAQQLEGLARPTRRGVSRRKPLACSTTTRLVSAERSCGITVAGRGRVFLQDRDARDVGQRLADQEIGVVEFAGAGAEQAERAQDDAGGAHRHGVHGGEAGVAARPGRTAANGRLRPARSATETGWPVE